MASHSVFIEEVKSSTGNDFTIQESAPSTATVVGLARNACSAIREQRGADETASPGWLASVFLGSEKASSSDDSYVIERHA